jgi:tRNA dimethylallyltransferase
MKETIRVLVLSGPTGVGKTKLAVCLAKLLSGELVSCDSVQVYRGADIGSNKEKDLDAPQHLIDLVEWNDLFSAGHYYDRCIETIQEIHRRGKIPLLVGGTNFYLTWLLQGKPSAPVATEEVMDRVHSMTRNKTWQESLELLSKYDPVYASTLHTNDFYRLHRALSIILMTGQPLSTFAPTSTSLSTDSHLFDFRCFYLTHDRELLARSIDKRCEEMIQKGLLQEVLKFRELGLDSSNYALGRAIGYHQALYFLDAMEKKPESKKFDEIFDDFLDQFQSASRQYGRRQDVWFKKHPMFSWLHWELFDCDFDKMSRFIQEAFCMDLKAFSTDTALKNTHQESLKRRFSDSLEKKMRVYKTRQTIFKDSSARSLVYRWACSVFPGSDSTQGS